VIDVSDVRGNVVVGGVDERLVQVDQQHQLPTQASLGTTIPGVIPG
jgi:hypothetical protein